jgi:hypothetical protein
MAAQGYDTMTIEVRHGALRNAPDFLDGRLDPALVVNRPALRAKI